MKPLQSQRNASEAVGPGGTRMPMWQQMTFVSLASMLNVLWQYLVAQMIGQVMLTTVVWFSVISSAVVWPVLVVSLHRFYARRVII